MTEIIMNEFTLNKFTEFGKIKDIWGDSLHDKKGLHEFLNNVVMNTDPNCNNGWEKMLPDLSDIYVLVSKQNFPFDKLSLNQKHSIDLSFANKNFVLGYIWLCPWILKNEECVPYHFINFIDSRISGLNIAKHMMSKYEYDYDYEYDEEKEEEERFLFPFEVISSAKNYWKKYFMNVYSIKNKNELEQMITEYKFKKSDIRWDELFSTFEI